MEESKTFEQIYDELIDLEKKTNRDIEDYFCFRRPSIEDQLTILSDRISLLTYGLGLTLKALSEKEQS